MDNWISVETNQVPQNNKPVFCLVEGKYPCVAFYTKCHETIYEPGDNEPEYDATEENTGDHYLKPGWYEECETPGGEYDSVFQSRIVTHWQYPVLPGEPTPQSELPARETKLREALSDLLLKMPSGLNLQAFHARDQVLDAIAVLSHTPPPVAVVPVGSVRVPVEDLEVWIKQLNSFPSLSGGNIATVQVAIEDYITAAKQKEEPK